MIRIIILIIFTSCILNGKELKLSNSLKTFIGDYCTKCHNEEKAKGDTRLDNVSYTIRNEAEAQHWKDILDVLNLDDMPPEKAKQPTLKEKEKAIGDLTEGLEHARKLLVDRGGEVLIRHMNNREYRNVIFDLLGIDISTRDMPIDNKVPFDTIAEKQHFSSVRFEIYNQLAEQALQKMFNEEKIRTSSKAKKRRYEFDKGSVDFSRKLADAEKQLEKLKAAKGNPKKIKELGLSGKYDRSLSNASNAVKQIKQTLKSNHFELYKKGGILGADADLTKRVDRQKFKIGKFGTYNFKVHLATVSEKPDSGAFLKINRGHRNDPEKDIVYQYAITGTLQNPQTIEFSMRVRKIELDK